MFSFQKINNKPRIVMTIRKIKLRLPDWWVNALQGTISCDYTWVV